jgi:hypothetical protein
MYMHQNVTVVMHMHMHQNVNVTVTVVNACKVFCSVSTDPLQFIKSKEAAELAIRSIDVCPGDKVVLTKKSYV